MSSPNSTKQDMQLPTHSRLHVRDTRDAHVVLEAVRRGLLRPVERRLNDLERNVNIRSGSVFVWEESNQETGIKRWTDGRLWSQSRMREPFLFYDEKLPDELYATDNSSPSYRFIDGTCRGVPTPAVAHFDRSNHHPKGLVKQAYSAKVQLGPNTRARKWHLTAYFSYEELENLPTIDDDVRLRRINPPPGVFRNGKSRSRDTGISMRRRSHSSDTASSSASSPPQSPIRTIRALPSFRPTQNTTARPKDEPLILPPLLSAIPRAFSGSSYVGAQKSRPVEDQRVIHMLNARHVS